MKKKNIIRYGIFILIISYMISFTYTVDAKSLISIMKKNTFSEMTDDEDRDNDGMADWWEKKVGLDTAKNDSQNDPDNDGLINFDEFKYGTHPFRLDTDADNLTDGEEVYQHGTIPTIADSDGGGKADGVEVAEHKNPLTPDDDNLADTGITVAVHLQPGWNLVSLPVSTVSDNIADILASISGSYAAVWANENGIWKAYDPALPGMSDLTAMETGKGYWIEMNDAATLTISGTITAHSIHLTTGWNLVGYNFTISQNITDMLSSIEGKYLSVWTCINNNVWQAYDPDNPGFNNLTKMEPGHGYWIEMNEACLWKK